MTIDELNKPIDQAKMAWSILNPCGLIEDYDARRDQERMAEEKKEEEA
jgi:hypothetical protein